MVTRRCPSGCTAGARDWRYTYTADDERLWTIEVANGAANVWTLRELDGRTLREYDAMASFAARDYVYRGTELLASNFPSEGDRHFHVDHLGTPRLITNSAGTVDAYHVYLPFGEEATAVAQDVERRKYTGHERDTLGTSAADDDRDYMHARYYSSLTARFSSVDSVRGSPKRPQTWNRYSYARNNPLRLIDSDGRAEKDALTVFVVPVNLVFSNADNPIRGHQTLRQVVEGSLPRTRNFFAQAGIALDVRRFEASLWPGHSSIDGPVRTPAGQVRLADFAKNADGLTVIVSGHFSFAGKTFGLGGPTMMGVKSDNATLTDELAHGLGNVTPVQVPILSNAAADLFTDFSELLVSQGVGLEGWLEEILRSGAQEVGCPPGDGKCGFCVGGQCDD